MGDYKIVVYLLKCQQIFEFFVLLDTKESQVANGVKETGGVTYAYKRTTDQ